MEMKRVGVVGAGQMGAGIAQVCASIGKAVTLCDIKQDFVDNGIASIQKESPEKCLQGSYKSKSDGRYSRQCKYEFR